MRSEARQRYRLARQYLDAGHQEEAEAAFRRAIGEDPSYGYPHYDLALLLEAKGGDPGEIADHYRRFIDLSGADPRLTHHQEWARRRISALEPALASAPTLPSVTADAGRPDGSSQGDTETTRCAVCRAVMPEGADACSNCGEWMGSAITGARRAWKDLPGWALGLIGAAAAALVIGAAFLVLLRTGRIVWPGNELPPVNVLSPSPVPTATAVPATATRAVAMATTAEPTVSRGASGATRTPAVAMAATSTDVSLPSQEPTATPQPLATAKPSATPTVQFPTLTATLGQTAVAVPDELPGRIAFPVFDAERGTYDVYLSSPDGSGLQKLIEQASQPQLSPDGSRMAFRRWKSDDRGVEVMDISGANLLRLSNFLEDGLPSWSPDSETLVFFSRRESDRNQRIYETKATGGDERELKRGVQPVYGDYPTWMGDGSVVYRATWPETGLAIMASDGSGERLISSDGTVAAPAASPDGAHVAFMSRQDGNWEIYRITADGTGLLRLTTNGARDGLPAWSPDGRTIAFVSERGGSWAIWAMTASGRGQKKLFDLPGSPDGLVAGEPDYASRGWLEERISWAP